MLNKDRTFIEGLSDNELTERLNYLRYGIEPDENFGMPDWVGVQIILCLKEQDKRAGACLLATKQDIRRK